MKRVKAIAQSLAVYSPSVKVSVRFTTAARIEITIHDPMQSSSFVEELLHIIYSQVSCPQMHHSSLVQD